MKKRGVKIQVIVLLALFPLLKISKIEEYDQILTNIEEKFA